MPPMPDYGIAAGVSGAAHKELVATAVEGGIGGEDSELGAYWELLEEDIRPVQPLKHSHLSAQIFMEHKEMARNYLILQQELFNLQRQKLLLEEKLSHSEQLEQCTNHRYQEKIKQLMGKRDDLSNNHAHLKQQLEHIRSQEKRPRPFSTATQQHITMGASLQLHQPPP
ncbi:unnamed protein product [Meganyctiphanes norvegica]|uniref:Mitogen-activated protein kinase kinase kinase n=1 Tax=Meganyctiphanes norvegica TaxID=48144 RepID=A0AAV2S9Y6_MEGNR